ncbi:hypothetical protein DBR32_09435 [Taibaiella sp. KBW10]|nr:hypothetical protein DBR32_09435 [Taibaiella sp. KBW10]
MPVFIKAIALHYNFVTFRALILSIKRVYMAQKSQLQYKIVIAVMKTISDLYRTSRLGLAL